jgi:glycosyltransferase involved in cell wall biosynthesis
VDKISGVDRAGLRGTLAVLHDMTEEGWPSMEQMGALLTSRVPQLAPGLQVTAIRHPLRRFATVGPLARSRAAFFADRVLNRLVLYPRRVRRQVAGRFDLYHVVDHSYAPLALELPARATVVTCHDVDTFRSIVHGGGERRPAWFRAMTRRILRGLRRAEIVVCVSAAARDELVAFELVHPSRLRVVPNGIDPAFLDPPDAAARAEAAALYSARAGVFDLLHVGNDIPRKRLDRLIEIVAALRQRGNPVRLVRVGAPLGPDTRRRAGQLDAGDIIELPFVDRNVLRALYERCSVLMLPSDREGFGLPVIEAFAAGKPVIASDIPALRESGGGLAACVRPDAIPEWVEAVERTLASTDPAGERAAARRRRAASLTWDDHVRGLIPVYAELLDRLRGAGR